MDVISNGAFGVAQGDDIWTYEHVVQILGSPGTYQEDYYQSDGLYRQDYAWAFCDGSGAHAKVSFFRAADGTMRLHDATPSDLGYNPD